MQCARKILLFFAMLIILAHTVIPHKHEIFSMDACHEYFENKYANDLNAGLIQKIENLIQQFNPGMGHLENFFTPHFKYDFSQPSYASELTETVSIPKFELNFKERKQQIFNYVPTHCSSGRGQQHGLRAPPLV